MAGAHGQEVVDSAVGPIAQSPEHIWVDRVSRAELSTVSHDFLNVAFGVHARVGNGHLELRSAHVRYLALRNGNILRPASHIRRWLHDPSCLMPQPHNQLSRTSIQWRGKNPCAGRECSSKPNCLERKCDEENSHCWE